MFKKVRLKIKKFVSRHLVGYTLTVLILGIVMGTVLIIQKPPDQVILGINPSVSWNLRDTNNATEEQKIAGVSDCKGQVCSNFRDDLWTEHPGLVALESGDYPLEVSTIVTESYRGGVKYLKSDKGAYLTVKFGFTPKGIQSNTAIHFFDSTELIIGDGGYSRVSCRNENKNEYLDLENHYKRHFDLQKPIKPGTQVEVIINTSPIMGKNQVRIEPIIQKYYTISGEKVENVRIPACIFDVPSDPEVLMGRVGVGLSDWQNTGDVRAELNYFYLQEKQN